MLPSYNDLTDVPINRWKTKDKKVMKDKIKKKYKQFRNLVILTSAADFELQDLETKLAGSFKSFSGPISVQIGNEEYSLWDAPAVKNNPSGAVVQEAINACGGEEALGIAEWGSADTAFRRLLDSAKQVRYLRCMLLLSQLRISHLVPSLLLSGIVTLPYQQQEQGQEQDTDDNEEPSDVASTDRGGQILEGSSRTKQQHITSAEAAAAAGSDAGRNCGSSSQEQVNAAGTSGAASVPRTSDTGKVSPFDLQCCRLSHHLHCCAQLRSLCEQDKEVGADDSGSASGHRIHNSKRTSSDSTGSTVTKRQRQSATQCSGDSSSGNKRESARGKGKAKKLAALESDISGDEPDGAQDEIITEQALRREIGQLRKQNAELTDAFDATVVQLRTSLAHCNAVLPPEVI
jgi:hypothetical protein